MLNKEILDGQKSFMKKIRDRNQEFYKNTGRNPRAFINTYGCQQNVSDSEHILGMLVEMGYHKTSSPEDAELVLFNTCAVREHAEQRVLGNIGALKSLKEKKPSMIIGVCGCMAQQESVAAKLKRSYPFVDLVFGTRALHTLPELLDKVMTSGKNVYDLTGEDLIVEGLPVSREGYKAWLSVMYGCNNFCSYCIVPYVRGRERSREPGDIVEEARKLVSSGVREITLLGQNVNSYGKNLSQAYSFAGILRDINAIPGDFIIRFMTSHPKDMSDELIDAMAECEKVAKYLHLPVQSGSDAILKRMNRRYDREHYLDLVSKIRTKMPGISLTSDIIVGFPGETDEDFADTLDLVRRVGYDNLFTFIYSKRGGTPAAELPDETPRNEKVRRMDSLLRVQEEITARLMASHVGKTERVLCEGESKLSHSLMMGRAGGGFIVNFDGGNEGEFMDVEITSSDRAVLYGRPVKRREHEQY